MQNWFAHSTTTDNRIFTISDEEKLLNETDTLIVKILVRFNATNVPEIESIHFNGKNLCGVLNNTRPIPKVIKAPKPLTAAEDVECGKIPLKGQPFIREGIKAAIGMKLFQK